jgi:hypothetical protein
MVPRQYAAFAAAVLLLPAVSLGFSPGSRRQQTRKQPLLRAHGHVPHHEALLQHRRTVVLHCRRTVRK